ncbi:MAG: HEAT repeat domain-containing protein [Gemmataceae bacterium]
MMRTTTVWLVLLWIASSAQAAELGSRLDSWEPRVVVAKDLSPLGSLLINEHPGQSWRTLGPNDAVHSRDLLLALPGMKARLETSPRAVELTLWGNPLNQSDFSGLESAVILHDSRSFDLDFTLRRGRVLVANRKEKGAVRVWLRVDGAAFLLTLGDPEDVVCLGLNSFWPRGAAFTLNSSQKPEESPVRSLNILAVKGQVDVKVGGVQYSLSAPPGLSAFHWDSVNGADSAPRHRKELDAWADPKRKPSANAAFPSIVAEYLAAAKEKDPRTVLFDLLAAADKEQEREKAMAKAEFAVFGLAAINDIERVMQALDDPRQAEVRKAAVIALRHWIGNDARRNRLLYQFLMDQLSYLKPQAATVLQLLHDGFPADEPYTYETLIAYLRHEKLPIRELAWRQLLRLVPEDLLIPYDPAAAADDRDKACAAWREFVPSGSLPSRKTKKK